MLLQLVQSIFGILANFKGNQVFQRCPIVSFATNRVNRSNREFFIVQFAIAAQCERDTFCNGTRSVNEILLAIAPQVDRETPTSTRSSSTVPTAFLSQNHAPYPSTAALILSTHHTQFQHPKDLIAAYSIITTLIATYLNPGKD